MYNNYQAFVNSIINNEDLSFKSNSIYTNMLEHVSFYQGNQYIHFIHKFINEYKIEITFEDINNYLLLNDKYGSPTKSRFIYDNNFILCSPSSLRYVLHALLILKHIKETGGYGGLFLAINHFAKILNIEITHYYFIDLPEICKLIERYVKLHENVIDIKYSVHTSYNYGNDINDENLFFVSNYCFTEIDSSSRNNYIKTLFPKIKNGFIIWQTLFKVPIDDVIIIEKEIKEIIEEYPQTATITNKNYYVYF